MLDRAARRAAGRMLRRRDRQGNGKSRSFILVLSAASNESAFVAREVERAVSKNKPVFTIRIEDVQPSPALELFISNTQWIDGFSGGWRAQSTAWRSLIAADDAGEPAQASGQPGTGRRAADVVAGAKLPGSGQPSCCWSGCSAAVEFSGAATGERAIALGAAIGIVVRVLRHRRSRHLTPRPRKGSCRLPRPRRPIRRVRAHQTRAATTPAI